MLIVIALNRVEEWLKTWFAPILELLRSFPAQFKLNRKIVWAGCVLDAFIPVIESQSKPLSEEEERILAAGGPRAVRRPSPEPSG